MMAGVTGLVLLVAAVVVGWFAARTVREDARRLSNAVWMGAALVLLAAALPMLGDRGLVQLVVMVAVLSPLLVAVLVGFLLWNGFTMIRREGHSLGNLLSLLAGVGIAGAVVVCLVLLFAWPSGVPLMLWIVLACAWVAALFCGYLAYSWFYQRVAGAVRPDFIVTLGSGLIGERVPPLLAGRIDRALTAYRAEVAAGRHPVLVMSGGQGADELVSEASAMAKYAVERGIPAADVIVEDRSRTTAENLRFTMELVRSDARLGDGARGVAVTSDYHAMRAAELARQVGAPVQVLGARTARYFWPSAVLREFVAVLRGSLVWQVVAALVVTVPLPLVFLWASVR